jgi:hypothetical protein
MANRYPLIANSSANQIQELASSDNIDLTGNYIVGVVGVNASGIITATSFVGDITGDVTGNADTATNASGLTGSPNITINNLVGVAATFSGVVTYEDVTNVDSLGIITARSGIEFGASGVGGTITAVGNAEFAGITTVTNFDAKGTLVEAFSSTTTAYNSDGNLNISNGNVQFSSANLGGTGTTLNIISTTGINTDLSTGQTLTVTGITAVNATTAFVNRITVDGVATGITTHWVGGRVPTDGGDSGVDLYTFNLLKTGSATYIIVANQTKTS